jgi:hypothetical protein
MVSRCPTVERLWVIGADRGFRLGCFLLVEEERCDALRRWP